MMFWMKLTDTKYMTKRGTLGGRKWDVNLAALKLLTQSIGKVEENTHTCARAPEIIDTWANFFMTSNIRRKQQQQQQQNKQIFFRKPHI